MATAEDLLDLARSYIGLTESPAGSNRQPFAAMAGHANGYAWCATFAVGLQKKLGMKVVADSAYTPTCAVMAGKAKRTVAMNAAQPGDHAVIDFPGGKNRIEHYVIIEKHLGGGRFQTIEGNTSASGSQTNGGAVLRKTRDFNTMRQLVIWRPYYDAVSAPAPGPVRPEGSILQRGDEGEGVVVWQQQLRDMDGADLISDGEFGPLTESATRAFQARHGLPITGWVSSDDIRTMEGLYAAVEAPEAPPQPDLQGAVRFMAGKHVDERIARMLGAALHLHTAPLEARQRVGLVYLVGGAAVAGYDRDLASEVVEVSGRTRMETLDAATHVIRQYIATL